MGIDRSKTGRRTGRERSTPVPAFHHRLIGLTGTNGAGKGEVASYLMKKGYAYVSLSDEIRADLRRRGKESTRDELIAAGNALRRRYGADILARRAMKKVKNRTVIDSIRNAREVAFLRRQDDFILVAVDAPAELRYARAQKRGRAESASTVEEFIAKEKEEMTGGRSGQQLRRCLNLADVTIINDGTLEALHRRIEERL
ncbi:MAG TPA: AAA family ATPase [Candidatus Desulfaltia sp.]|nr:AAA family ATPase [Candidatus Desulfaltia sp.]